MITFKKYLEEAMSKTFPLVSEKETGTMLQYFYRTDENKELKIEYMLTTTLGHKGLNLQFAVDNNTTLTNKGESFSIFATVIDNINMVIKRRNPDFIYFGLNPSRKRIYTRLFKKFSKGKNYVVFVGDVHNISIIMVFNRMTVNIPHINKFEDEFGIENMTQIV